MADINEGIEPILEKMDIPVNLVVDSPWFTGWKFVDPIDETKGAVSQLIWPFADGTFVGINMPGMNVIRGTQGSSFEIGTERVIPPLEPGKNEEVLRRSLELLLEEVDKAKRAATDSIA